MCNWLPRRAAQMPTARTTALPSPRLKLRTSPGFTSPSHGLAHAVPLPPTSGKTGKMKYLLLSLAFLAPVLHAQEWAKQKLEKSTRHREWVKVQHVGRSVDAYIVY